MSATGLLEALKRHDLIQYYPIFMEQNIVSLTKLARVPETDYTKLGVLEKDRPKLEALTKQIVNQNNRKAQGLSPTNAAKSSPTRPSNPNNIIIPTTAPTSVVAIPTNSNKRPYFKSPPRNTSDRSKRRMTLAPTTVIPRTLPNSSPQSSNISNNSNNTNANIPNLRRLSHAFPPSSNRRQTLFSTPTRQNHPLPPLPSSQYTSATPKRPTVSPKRYNAPSQPQQQNRSTSKSGLFSTAASTSKAPTTSTIITTAAAAAFDMESAATENVPQTRALDAYGIPISSQKQKLSSFPSTNPVSVNMIKYRQTGTANNNQPQQQQQQQISPVRINNNRTSLLLSSTMNPELNQRIRVCVRKRPLNKKELNNQETDIASLVSSRTIQIHAPKTKIDLTPFTETHSFTFDDAFDENTTNQEIYARTAKPLVEYVFTGGRATCFAHGQTGSGKTYTMLDPEHGLYVLAAHDIFHLLSQPEYRHLTASIGFYEIYQGQLFDLLNRKTKLNAREDGNGNVVIAGLREHTIDDVDQLMQVFDYGNASRTTGKTGANNTSSRSHAVLQISLRYKAAPSTTPPSSSIYRIASSATGGATSSKLYGKLIFIDLAGSERGADRGEANTQTRMEGAEINKSLLALKECIRALDQNKSHTPFRGSKLTQVLRDSFTGDSRTCMIATISPNVSNSEHTLNTLRYADRVKQLRGESDPRLLGSTNESTYTVTTSTAATSIKKGLQTPSRSPVKQQRADEAESYEDDDDDVYKRPIEVEGFEMDMDTPEDDDYGYHGDRARKYYFDNNDNRSVAANSDIWEEAGVSENLFEVDFPVSQTALTTPNNDSQRHYSRSVLEPPPTTPRRKEKYMKRLESPPEEAFKQNMDSNFFTPPLIPTMDEDDDLNDIPPIDTTIAADYSPITRSKIPDHSVTMDRKKRELTSPTTSPRSLTSTSKRAKFDRADESADDRNIKSNIDLTGIQRFLDLHKTQVKVLDRYLQREREMAEQLEQLISRAGTDHPHNNNDDGYVVGNNPEIIEAYEDFLNDLAEITETKCNLLAALSKELKTKRDEQQ